MERNNKGQFVKGRILTDSEKKILSDAHKKSYMLGISKPYNKGGKCSLEHRQKVSIALKGKKKKPFSEEHKNKLSNITKIAWKNEKLRQKMIGGMRGRKDSVETIEKRVSQFRGENNWNWLGGITPVVRAIRNCWPTQLWSKRCKERDGYKCVLCNSIEKLQVDHIKPFSILMRENNIKTLDQARNCPVFWDMNNGRTLCKDCHTKTSTYGGSKK